MILYFEKFVSHNEFVRLEILSALIKGIRTNPVPVVTCHELAEAVALEFGMRRLCGYYGGIVEHSWCEATSNRWYDVYPVGILPAPLLVDGKALHNKVIYQIRLPQPLFSVRQSVVADIRHEFRAMSGVV